MDALWTVIFSGIMHMQAGILLLVRPLHHLGPVFTIAVLAIATALLARFLTRRCKTKRYRQLEEEFAYWYNVKQKALAAEDADPKKAKEMGITIDKARLNEVYYNFFFEGLLNNLLTMYIPIFSMLAFVNYTYHPEALQEMFGRPQLFFLALPDGGEQAVGAVFWFVICVSLVYISAFASSLLRKGGKGPGAL
jgi:hypothetical protein